MRSFAFLLSALCVIILCGTGCNPARPSYGEGTIIRGTILFPHTEKIYALAFADSTDQFLNRKSVCDSAMIAKDGSYNLGINLKRPSILDLKIGDSLLISNLFLFPEDKLTINFNLQQKLPEFIQDGETARCNEYLFRYFKTFYNNPDTFTTYYIRTNYMDFDHFLIYNKGREYAQLSFYKKEFEARTVRKEFSDWAMADIYYQIGVDRLMFIMKKRMKGEIQLVDTSFYDYFNTRYLENENAMVSTAYIHMLNLYIDNLYDRQQQLHQMLIKRETPSVPVLEKYHLAIKHLHGKAREIVLINLIYTEAKIRKDENLLENISRQTLSSLVSWLRNQHPEAVLPDPVD